MIHLFNRFIAQFLKFFFHLLYHSIAWSYNLVAAIVSLGMWNQWIESVIPFLDDGPILEIGFGTGYLQAWMQQKNHFGVGLDESWQMIRQTRTRLARQGYEYRLARGLAQDLPFRDQVFSRVVATFPSEYIRDPATLHEIWRALQPGGYLIVLPVAWITGRSLPHRLAAGLFRLTNEAPPRETIHSTWLVPFERQIKQSGFHFEQIFISLKHSEVLIIQAKKIDPAFDGNAPNGSSIEVK